MVFFKNCNVQKVILKITIIMVFSIYASACISKEKSRYNFDFEYVDILNNTIRGWDVGQINEAGLPANALNSDWHIDSVERYSGNYSLCLDLSSSTTQYIACGYALPLSALHNAKSIKLTGYIKTENVVSGFAGLWVRVDGEIQTLQFDNMSNRGVTGSTDWTQYTIELPYQSNKATQVIIGGLLVGKGKAWIDKLDFCVDGISIESYSNTNSIYTEKEKVTTINNFNIDEFKTNNLRKLCEVWGFLKYHHPNIVSGRYDMDNELFRILPKVINVKSKSDFNIIIEDWISSFGTVPPCNNCIPHYSNSNTNTKQNPDYDLLFNIDTFNESIVHKLNELLINRNIAQEQHYVKLSSQSVKNPVFINEESYPNADYSDAGMRLLTLFRYWNIVQYFYPYRYLLHGSWDNVLSSYIPDIVNCKSKEQFLLSLLKVVEHVGDSHAGIFGNKVLEEIKGEYYVPFETEFIDNKLFVTGSSLLNNSVTRKDDENRSVEIGDEIIAIDDISIKELLAQYLPYTPGSNIQSKLRDLVSVNGFLFRSKKAEPIKLKIKRASNYLELHSNKIRVQDIGTLLKQKVDTNYYILHDSIGYINVNNLKYSDFYKIKTLFKNTCGVIIDLRKYPTTDIAYTYGSWLNNRTSPFAIFSSININSPGLATLTDTAYIQGDASGDHYKGIVVLLVNSGTQSAGEFACMALQSSDNVITIGSTSAGADGNISKIILPFNIVTYISGIGVYYPNGGETQRVGIKIDKYLLQTQKNNILRNDLLVEKAVKIIVGNR